MYRAHIRKEPIVEQSVYDHSHQVSELAKGFGAKLHLESASELVGLLHDMGKYTKTFDGYIEYSFNHPEDHSMKGKIDHSTAGAKYIFEKYYLCESDPFRKFSAQLIAVAICSHHGGLIDCLDLSGIDKFTARMLKDDKGSYFEAKKNFEKLHCTKSVDVLFDNAVIEFRDVLSSFRKLEEEKEYMQLMTTLHLKSLFSCLIDADRTDTYTFMENISIEESDTLESLWSVYTERLEDYISLFSSVGEINRLRSEISTECKAFADNPSGVYQLAVPTGGGKTLSSLRYALFHAKKFNKERILYVIPFTTIIDQSAKVIKDILEDDEHILEHHSNLMIEDQQDNYEVLTENWQSSIVLTTMVQFLETVYNGGTRSVRRFHNLANSVIIFDEIQALPIKCIQLFNSAINYLSGICGATVVLCTATQPTLSSIKNPLRLSENHNMIHDVHKNFQMFKRVTIQDSMVVGGYSIDGICDFVEEKRKTNHSILLVLNTKKVAHLIFRELQQINKGLTIENQYTLYHLSTNMCPAHRKEILEELHQSLKCRPTICISTQLIEAGIDISFQCVIRSLAGLDSIAQAAGRCNRHGENSMRDVFIVNLADENVNRLKDIKGGQECTLRVLHEYQNNPSEFDYDLLSPKAMERYYRYYYYNRQNDMCFPLSKPNEARTIVDLLANNTEAVNAYYSRYDESPDMILRQSFRTAGKEFHVIEQNTIGVLVPYHEGVELIAKINGQCSLNELKQHLKKAQQYSVNLFESDRRRLDAKGALVALKDGLVIALREGFYSKKVGIELENDELLENLFG